MNPFIERALTDAAGMFAGVLAMLGDRLGLFKALAGEPATAAQLAERAGVDERYALEWLRGMRAAGYVESDGDRYSLPPAQAEVLADEGGPFFLGGAFETTLGYLEPIERLIGAFRDGGGVPQEAYPEVTWHGMSRFSRPMYDHQLVQAWLPALGLTDALEGGIRWADVGCGAGHALHRLAEAYPASTFVGYDQFPGQLALASANGVSFQALDVAAGLPERYDVISAFDVIHDAADPPALLRAIREALNPGGTFVMLEMLSADDPAANVGPVATIMYGVSVLYCMTTSLAQGGHGLGTYGLPAARVRELCLEAGFSHVEAFPPQDPFNALYAVRP